MMDKFDELVKDIKVMKTDDVILRFNYLCGNPAFIVVCGSTKRAMELYETLQKEISDGKERA